MLDAANYESFEKKAQNEYLGYVSILDMLARAFLLMNIHISSKSFILRVSFTSETPFK